MGIKNLSKLITCDEISFKDLGTCTIGIDMSIYVYKYICTFKLTTVNPVLLNTSQTTSTQTSDNLDTTVIAGIIKKILQLIKLNITPVIVFDGKPPEAKLKTIESRKQSIDPEILKRIKNIDYTKIKNILTILGIPWIQSPGESDCVLTYLYLTKQIDYVLSNDLDILCYLARNAEVNNISRLCLLREINSRLQIFRLKDILKHLDMSPDQFVKLCILCGCDYTGTIRGIGPVKAKQFVKSNKDIQSDTCDYNLALTCFTLDPELQNQINEPYKNFKLQPFNEDNQSKIKQILKDLDFTEHSINNIVTVRMKNCCAQKTIFSFVKK